MVKKWLGADRGLWWQWLILLNSVQHGWSGDFKRQCYCTFSSNLDLWIANTGNAFLLHTDSDTLLAHIWDRVALDSFCCWYLPPLLFSQNVNICSVCWSWCLIAWEGCGHSDASGSLAMCWDFMSYDISLAELSVTLVLCPWWSRGYVFDWKTVLFYASQQKGNPELSYAVYTPNHGGPGEGLQRQGLLYGTFASFLLIGLIFFT